jgi:hypothetical protein
LEQRYSFAVQPRREDAMVVASDQRKRITMQLSTHRLDIHQEITHRSVKALEIAGEFKLP